MQHSTWTLRTIENGETDQVRTGLSHAQAVTAIERAIRGLDPIEDERQPLRTVEAKSAETKLPVAA